MGRVDICKINWSFYKVLWGSSAPNTISLQRRTPKTTASFPGMDAVLFHIHVRTLCARDKFGELAAIPLLVRPKFETNPLECQDPRMRGPMASVAGPIHAGSHNENLWSSLPRALPRCQVERMQFEYQHWTRPNLYIGPASFLQKSVSETISLK